MLFLNCKTTIMPQQPKQRPYFFLYLLMLTMLLLIGCSSTRAPVVDYSSELKSDRFKRHHIVRKGETLYSIAWRVNLDYHKLAKWNGIAGPEYRILPGQQLRLKPPIKPLKAIVQAKKSRPSVVKSRASVVKNRAKKIPKQTAAVSPNRLKLHWDWPTIGAVVRKYAKTDHRRQGIRIAGIDGQRVTAAESGKVVYSGSGLIGYGNLVIIKHNSTYLSAYAHNRRIFVKEGMRVSKGVVISEMGIVPDSKKPALHFEIRENGKPVDPQKLLPKRR
ncbi:MAG: peptidoglycan DD-metalloendopeptidase family protein [Candidatus Polarisedimenticolaceae bacterium]|nr:peptidoglycan DD-metalloendopeptidase family protein [Candidatus Polarisedimenticolaceae bacterium]